MKGFQHLECASQNAYKHNGFPMNLLPFLRNVLQVHQYSTGFMRFWQAISPMAPLAQVENYTCFLFHMLLINPGARARAQTKKGVGFCSFICC